MGRDEKASATAVGRDEKASATGGWEDYFRNEEPSRRRGRYTKMTARRRSSKGAERYSCRGICSFRSGFGVYVVKFTHTHHKLTLGEMWRRLLFAALLASPSLASVDNDARQVGHSAHVRAATSPESFEPSQNEMIPWGAGAHHGTAEGPAAARRLKGRSPVSGPVVAPGPDAAAPAKAAAGRGL